MRRILCITIAALMLLTLVACSGQTSPEPERCHLCDYIPSHAPCLVNLNTGEVGEIVLYEPHHTLVGEIAETQRGGYFCFMSVAGLRGHMNASVPEAHVTVPEKIEKYDEQYFCTSCRGLLDAYSGDGFVLADLKEPSTPVLFPVEDGSSFEVRCYTVTVTKTEDKELDICVIGSIPTDE